MKGVPNAINTYKCSAKSRLDKLSSTFYNHLLTH